MAGTTTAVVALAVRQEIQAGWLMTTMATELGAARAANVLLALQH